MRILIVEDERRMARGLQGLLTKQGYAVDTVYTGSSGLDYALSGIYDLIILDIMLPEMDGLSVLRRLRSSGVEVPVLLLTAKSEVEERVRGLDCGADDYLSKPFDTSEFLARVRALTRRRDRLLEDTLHFGDVSLDRGQMMLCCGSERIRLGPKEFQIMECLMEEKNRVVSRQRLYEKVWGLLSETEYNNVEVYITFLRRKLRALHSRVQIRSARGTGYFMEVGE